MYVGVSLGGRLTRPVPTRLLAMASRATAAAYCVPRLQCAKQAVSNACTVSEREEDRHVWRSATGPCAGCSTFELRAS